jgi:hypothetical protein
LHKAQSKQKNKTFASTENQKTSGLRRKKKRPFYGKKNALPKFGKASIEK